MYAIMKPGKVKARSKWQLVKITKRGLQIASHW